MENTAQPLEAPLAQSSKSCGADAESSKAQAEQARLLVDAALPRRAEFFISDPHGEFEALSHIMKSGCGEVRRLIDQAFPGLPDADRAELAALVCYPEEKLPLLLSAYDEAPSSNAPTPQTFAVATGGAPQTRAECLAEVIGRLVLLVQHAAGSIPYSELLALLPDVQPVVADLLAAIPVHGFVAKAEGAYAPIALETLAATPAAPNAVIQLCHLAQRIVMPHLHLVGDIYDRGPAPDKIVDALTECPSVDIQWGNHDIVWMGAALGQRGCIAHVVRNCARYGNLDILEEGYGISLAPLREFAQQAYANDPCVAFGLKVDPGLSPEELDAAIKVQKAMAILQFKVEAQLIDENPSFGLESRKLLHRIDWDNNTVEVDGTVWPLADIVFPTVDPANPYALTPGEEAAMQSLVDGFVGSEKLQRHIRFLLDAGSLYKVANGNLLLHACVPLNSDGSLMEVELFGKTYKGRALYDAMQEFVYEGFRSDDPAKRKRGQDIMWYLWLGQGSPLFAKSKMATFEIYLIADKAARKEEKDAFYKLFDQDAPYEGIFKDFGLDPETAHIVCGHVPVKVKDGEDPVKAGGKVICIDGGMSVAYSKTTGIAGFTLVSDAKGLVLYSHQPFAGTRAVIAENAEMESAARTVEEYATLRTRAETDA